MPDPNPNPDLDRLVDLAIAQAERVLIGVPGATILPTFVLERGNGEIVIFCTAWENETHKEITVLALRAIMREDKVERYSFISEAWLAVAKPGTEHLDRLPDDEMPSQRPDRVEVVIISASDKDTVKSAILRIIRGEAGTVVRLDRDLNEAKQVRGRFADLLRSDPNEM